MALTVKDQHILELISKYTFLDCCNKKGLISEETRQQIVFSFGSEANEIIDYYVCRLDEHYQDTSRFIVEGKSF